MVNIFPFSASYNTISNFTQKHHHRINPLFIRLRMD